MLSRIAGRLLTSPVAFFAGGLIDFVSFWATWVWGRAWRRGIHGAVAAGVRARRRTRMSGGTGPTDAAEGSP